MPNCAVSGIESTNCCDARFAASKRVPPSTSSSFMESEASIISAILEPSVAASADSELFWANDGHAVHPMASAMAIMRASGRKIVLRGTLAIPGAPSHEIQPPGNRRLEAPQYLDKVNFSETNYNSSVSARRAKRKKRQLSLTLSISQCDPDGT